MEFPTFTPIHFFYTLANAGFPLILFLFVGKLLETSVYRLRIDKDRSKSCHK